ncbi:hypothetical protein D3C78_537630 [compost metagenome]
MPNVIVHRFVVTRAEVKVQQFEETARIFTVNLLDLLNDATTTDGSFRQPDFALIRRQQVSTYRPAVEVKDQVIIVSIRAQLHGSLQ